MFMVDFVAESGGRRASGRDQRVYGFFLVVVDLCVRQAMWCCFPQTPDTLSTDGRRTAEHALFGLTRPPTPVPTEREAISRAPSP